MVSVAPRPNTPKRRAVSGWMQMRMAKSECWPARYAGSCWNFYGLQTGAQMWHEGLTWSWRPQVAPQAACVPVISPQRTADPAWSEVTIW